MKSCGKCVHFTESGYKNWGYCEAPVPECLLHKCAEGGSNTVWRDGGSQDYAKDCDLYAPEIIPHACNICRHRQVYSGGEGTNSYECGLPPNCGGRAADEGITDDCPLKEVK